MNKQELSNKVAELWNELNSDISKDSKLSILLDLEGLIDTYLKAGKPRTSFIISCDVVLEQFREKLEVNPNYKEESKLSDLGLILLAITNSDLLL